MKIYCKAAKTGKFAGVVGTSGRIVLGNVRPANIDGINIGTGLSLDKRGLRGGSAHD